MKNPKWTGLAYNGAVAVCIGLLFIFVPQEFVLTIVQIIGVLLGLTGLMMLAANFFRKKSKGPINVYYLFQGFLNLGFGGIMLVNPEGMIDFLMLIVGLWALAIGLFQFVTAVQMRKLQRSGNFLLINGLAFIVIALLMILNPQLIITTLMALVGALVSLLGVILLYFAYLLYQKQKITSHEVIE